MNAVTGGSNRDWRDRVGLALLVGAGLRRDEAVNLNFAEVRRQPIREKVRTILQVRGKGAKDRVVPISEQLVSDVGDLARQVWERPYPAVGV